MKAQQLGRYHLLDRIAFGGMAEIFRAKTFDGTGVAHLVAVKRVLAHLVEDEASLAMLIDEAKLHALLRHPNIVRIYEFARAGREYLLAMEYVDGKDGRALLERCRALGAPVSPEHAAWIAMHIALALHSAHHQCDSDGRLLRVVHRDVSPSNLLCSYQGEVKLCDFGIAKSVASQRRTQDGMIKGKARYMSPEQARGHNVDFRSDLFSLGAVLYELLTLDAPFRAPTDMELLVAVREARFIPLGARAPHLPAELIAIVERAMAPDRSDRYSSGRELAKALAAFLDREHPDYRRGNFARHLRHLFAEDIDRELRALEAFVIGEADRDAMGENLIADALGPNAPFARFSPVAVPAALPTPSASSEELTRPAKRAPSPAGPGQDLHDEDTHLFDAPSSRDPDHRGIHERSTRLIIDSSMESDDRSATDDEPLDLPEPSTRRRGS